MRAQYLLENAGIMVSEINDIIYRDNKIYLYNNIENIKVVSTSYVLEDLFRKISADLLVKDFCNFEVHKIVFKEF